MRIDYRCADCDATFPLQVSERELRTTISGTRDERCPRCEQRVGYGAVVCVECHHSFVVRMPLRHAQKNLAFGKCARCGSVHLQPAEFETSQ
jgi:DNA-directed RNA polymerase subunit RPC12/RpoP